MTHDLRLALIHMDIRHKDGAANRNTLVRLNTEAAEAGARIIVNPEHSVAGFSFKNRSDVAAHAEPQDGPTLSKLAALAVRHQIYMCVPLAEKDPRTGIFYNSAFVLGPEGTVVTRTRKVTADPRWACPGDPRQDAYFDTPWGRVGILICSDTYHGLMSRCMALKGVDLLLVPANWPAVWFDPRILWKARALENGFHVAVCNRTGKDPMMSFLDARSCVYDPAGSTLLDSSSPKSRVFLTHLKLNSGMLPSVARQQILETRTPESYHAAYLDLRMIGDLTEHYNLPQTGKLWIHCVSLGGDSHRAADLIPNIVDAHRKDGWNLFVLSEVNAANVTVDRARTIADRAGAGIMLKSHTPGKTPCWIFAQPERTLSWETQGTNAHGIQDPRLVDFGSARLGIVSVDEFLHPELAVSLSKLGCDLALLSESSLTDTDHAKIAVKTIDQLAVAAAGTNRSFIRLPPELRKTWTERSIIGTGTCSLVLETATTRNKNFHDRVDYRLLFSKT